MHDNLLESVTEVLRKAPVWLRHDLASENKAARTRAEEALAAMIAAALDEGTRDPQL
jgi:hypothetical protein